MSGFLISQPYDKKNIEVLAMRWKTHKVAVQSPAHRRELFYNCRGDPEGNGKRIGPMAQDMPLYCAGSENKTNLNSAAMDGEQRRH